MQLASVLFLTLEIKMPHLLNPVICTSKLAIPCLVVLVVSILVDSVYSQYSLREWRDSDGKLKAIASFVKADESEVTLREKKAIQVPITQLCARDQTLISEIVILEKDEAEYSSREWNDASGKFKVTASFVKANKSEVTLSVESEIQETIGNLCNRDQEYVRATLMLEQDDAQYRKVMEHSQRFRADPSSAIEIFRAINDSSPKAPYAAAMLGVAYAAAGREKYSDARKFLIRANQLIKKRRKLFGEDYQKLTELAVNNNLAVVHLKFGESSKAVDLLKRNAELTDENVNFCTSHNARLLLDAVTSGKSPVKVAQSSRKKLAKLVANMPELNADFDVPKTAPVYFLEVSPPMSVAAFETLLAEGEEKKLAAELRAIMLARDQFHFDFWCLQCKGKALLNCSCSGCVNGFTEKYTKVFSHHDYKGTPFYRVERDYVKCPGCNKNGKVTCPHCDKGKVGG